MSFQDVVPPRRRCAFSTVHRGWQLGEYHLWAVSAMRDSSIRRQGKRKRSVNRIRRLFLENLEDRIVLSNVIVTENQLPGTSNWGVSGAGDTSIQGFATDISVNHGQT